MNNPRKFLVSVGIALAALVPNKFGVEAANVEGGAADSSPESATPTLRSVDVDSSNQLIAPILETLTYRAGSEQHLLLLRKPANGAVYADHSSHESHGSHSSHSSGN
jgi:hypothetical protein